MVSNKSISNKTSQININTENDYHIHTNILDFRV